MKYEMQKDIINMLKSEDINEAKKLMIKVLRKEELFSNCDQVKGRLCKLVDSPNSIDNLRRGVCMALEIMELTEKDGFIKAETEKEYKWCMFYLNSLKHAFSEYMHPLEKREYLKNLKKA